MEPPPPRLHVRDDVLAAQVDRGEVHLLHPAPGLDAGDEDRVVVGRGDPRVVERDVDPAVGAQRGRRTSRATSSSAVTSAWTNRPPTSSAAALPVSPSRSTTTTLAPSAASRRAVASPMPLAAPVTTATRSSRRCIALVTHSSGCDEDVLGLGERVQGVRPQLAAEPGLLEAAERRPVAHGGVRVDRQVAGLDRPGHPQRAAQVCGPDRPGQPVRGVVGDRAPRPPRPRTAPPPPPARRPPRCRPGRPGAPAPARSARTSSRGRRARCRGTPPARPAGT